MLSVSPTPDELGIIAIGGAGTHTAYVPSLCPTPAVTREIDRPGLPCSNDCCVCQDVIAQPLAC